MATLYELLKIMLEKNASDLHISTGTPPRVRVNGKLAPLDNVELSPAETKSLCYSILTDTQKHKFEEHNELDLSFGEADLDDIRRDGIASLESSYAEGVNESLMLFAELLGYPPPPKAFRVPHCTIFAAVYRKESGEEVIGPAVIYSLVRNELVLTEEQFSSFDKEKIERFHLVAGGKSEAAARGAAVFEQLQKAVIRSRSKGN